MLGLSCPACGRFLVTEEDPSPVQQIFTGEPVALLCTDSFCRVERVEVEIDAES